MSDRPPASGLATVLVLVALCGLAGTVLATIEAESGQKIFVFAGGTVGSLLLLALASIVSSLDRAAWYAQQAEYHARRTTEELSKLSRQSASPAKAGTN